MAKYVVLVSLLVTGGLGAVWKPTPKVDPTLSWQVEGRSEAPDGGYPHQISLRYFGSHNCGGSIVSKNYVITAAHCVAGDSPWYLSVVTGTNQLNNGGDTYDVEKIYYHENYNPWDIQNNVAILKVAEITFTHKVASIVVETEDVGGDVPVILSGWSKIDNFGTIPNNLQQLNLKTTTIDYCKSQHSTSVFESEICTLTETGKGACYGDYGGPLIRVVKGTKKLIGIVSWSRPCSIDYPDIFSRVSSFVDWFNDKCNNCLNQGFSS